MDTQDTQEKDSQEKDSIINNKVEYLKIRIPTPKPELDIEEDEKSKDKKYSLFQSIFCCFYCINHNIN